MTGMDTVKVGAYCIVEYEPKYAASLAWMWNESDSVWPGTITRGVPVTEEIMLDYLSRERYLNTFLALAEGRVVGECELVEHSQVEDAVYVGMLSVHPKYHGRGYGRELLKKAIQRTIELGYKRLDLDTWPGNLRAIPLYKKTGFFWVPETQVDMVNYIPLILAHPLTQEFFRQVDWYEHFQRDLSVKEDDYRQGEMKVLPYEWEKDGKRLRVVIDRVSGGIVAFENERFSASLQLSSAKIPAGMEGSIEWQICGRGDRPLSVSLLAEGRGGVEVEKSAALEVKGEVKLCAPVRASASPGGKEEKPGVKTTLLVEGHCLPLDAGLECPQPIEPSLEVPHTSLVPGVGREIHVRLKNHLREDIKGMLLITPGPGLEVRPKQAEFSIGAEGLAGIPSIVAAERGGGLQFSVRVAFQHSGQQLETQPKDFHLCSVPIGGIAAYQSQGETVLENGHLRLVIDHSQGRAKLEAKALARPSVTLTSTLGPPFYWGRGRKEPTKVELREEGGRLVVVAVAEPKEYPGLTLRREFVLTSGPVLELRHIVLNASDREHRLQVKLGQWTGRWREAGRRLALPLKDGLVIDQHNADFPDWWDPEAYKPDRYAENWQATLWPEGLAVGCIWRRVARIEGAGDLVLDLGAIPPQGRAGSEPVYIYIGYGGWQAVRRFWEALSGQPARGESPQPRAVLEAKLVPEPAVVARRGKLRLSIRNRRSYALVGTARLLLPDGWEASHQDWELAGVNRDAPFEARLHLERKSSPFADICQAKLALETHQDVCQFRVPIISLGDGRTMVKVEEDQEAGQAIVRVDNGCLRFKVAPHFAGSLYSLAHQGMEQLMSAFPEARPFAWMNPWHGGFRPTLRAEGQRVSRTHREGFQYRLIERAGPRNILWKGVCLSSELTQEALRGLRLEVEYLTTGCSNVLAMVLRAINHTSAPFGLRGEILGTLQIGGRREALLHYLACGRERVRKPAPEWLEGETESWAALEDPCSGAIGTLVAASEKARISFEHLGQEGALMGLAALLSLGPGEAKELVGYFVLTNSLEKARLYRALNWAQGIL